jgi:hypothetical protein
MGASVPGGARLQPTMRDKSLSMRLSAEEWARFEAVAEHYGLPVAFMIRMLVKKEEIAIQTSPAGGNSRWEFVKREAIALLPMVQLPRLRVSFDERTRTIVLSDGKVTRLVRNGESAWYALSAWPGSQLRSAQEALESDSFRQR